MDELNKYEITFSGLKEGEHLFEFELDHKFFDNFKESEVHEGSLSARIILDKKPGFLKLDFHIEGEAEVKCDRCLEYFGIPIKYNDKVYVKFGVNSDETTDDMLVINENEHKLNIAQFLYEFILLSLPYRRVHPLNENGESSCNIEMLNRLKELSFRDNNSEKNDPRWNNLKDLLKDNNFN